MKRLVIIISVSLCFLSISASADPVQDGPYGLCSPYGNYREKTIQDGDDGKMFTTVAGGSRPKEQVCKVAIERALNLANSIPCLFVNERTNKRIVGKQIGYKDLGCTACACTDDVCICQAQYRTYCQISQ
jgi:hypothetical protein